MCVCVFKNMNALLETTWVVGSKIAEEKNVVKH